MPTPTTPAATPAPFRFIDEDGFCLSARLLPDLNTGRPTATMSITIEGSDEPQSVHVPVDQLPLLLAGIAAAGAVALAWRHAEAALTRVEELVADWEQRGEYGDASLLVGARAIRSALGQPTTEGTV